MNLEKRLRGGLERHSDQLLCLSLLVLIVVHPLLDYGPIRRSIQALLTFIPAVLAIGVVAKTKQRVWLPVALLFAALLLAILGAVTSNPALLALEWTALAAFFFLIVAALFSYLQRVHQIANRHLYTAASIYLLLGLLWFALYNIIEVLFPGSFLEGGSHLMHRRSGLLYFSLATLTTVGYGDIVPAAGVARTLSALEAGAGVLYVAITARCLSARINERNSNQLRTRPCISLQRNPKASAMVTAYRPIRRRSFTVLRLYSPLEPFFTKKWRPSEIEGVK